MSEGPLSFPGNGADREPETDAERATRIADEESRWAHRRDPDLDEPMADRPPAPARRAAGASRYGWFVGVVAVLAIGYITINSATTERASSTGLKPGEPLPPFAMPLALGGLEGDANVAERNGSGQAGARAACDVRGKEILNVCELAERGPLVLAFIATRGADCVDDVERIAALSRRHGLQFAVISISGDRGDLRKLVRRRGWRFPVGHDRDGAVTNRYGVAACPHLTFARHGGITEETVIGRESLRDAPYARLERSAG